jgi:hypothetical protein
VLKNNHTLTQYFPELHSEFSNDTRNSTLYILFDILVHALPHIFI